MAAFALAIEAGAAISLLFAAYSSFMFAVYGASPRLDQQLRLSDSVYDFFSVIRGNSTYSGCVESQNAGCISVLLRKFGDAYGLAYASFTRGALLAHVGNTSTCTMWERFCVPLRNANSTGIGCLAVCGD